MVILSGEVLSGPLLLCSQNQTHLCAMTWNAKQFNQFIFDNFARFEESAWEHMTQAHSETLVISLVFFKGSIC